MYYCFYFTRPTMNKNTTGMCPMYVFMSSVIFILLAIYEAKANVIQWCFVAKLNEILNYT